MSGLYREALEARLASLEDIVLETLGAPPSEATNDRACATCYALEDECFCPAPVMWPITAVAYKLRAELTLQGNGTS